MDAAALRQLQAPLKQRYRDDPASAVAQLHAEADFSDAGITCTVQAWAGPTRAGFHPFTGGDGSDACSGDMLLQALLACAGVTMRSVATAMGIGIRGGRLGASTEMDARGTLGVSREARVGLGDIEVVADLDTDADDATLTKLAELTERYCVVARTLARPPHLTIRRVAAPPA
jgi:uncharacterized OsmC-like protein